MNLIDIPTWIPLCVGIVLAFLGGYFRGNAEPGLTAALYAADQLTTPQRAMKTAESMVSKAAFYQNLHANNINNTIILLAALTNWWIVFPTYLCRHIAMAVVQQYFIDNRIGPNLRLLTASLEDRAQNFKQKGDNDKEGQVRKVVAALQELPDLDRHDQLPSRLELYKSMGLRRPFFHW